MYVSADVVTLGKTSFYNAEECVCVSEWIQVNMIDIETSFGATDVTFWKTNCQLNHADRGGPVHAFR